jgi:Calcineurin-like phosphoesterase
MSDAGRTVIVGDVHGCRAELEDLLDKVGFGEGDRLFLTGDLISRGPDSPGVIALARRLGAAAVRGNHEEKLLRWHAARRSGLPPEPLGDMHRQVARSLRREHWDYLAHTPLWLDLPEHGVRLVHAGVVPGVAIEHQSRRTLLTVRSLGPAGEPLERPGGAPWASRYFGPPHIIFGHYAQREPQLHTSATGIDTGCVYGGELTAMVLRSGEQVPAPDERRDLLVRVLARRRYFGSNKNYGEKR